MIKFSCWWLRSLTTERMEMGTKIWLDDIRLPPDESWFWVKNFNDLNQLLNDEHLEVEVISFDHDLGDNTPDGSQCASRFIEIGIERGWQDPPEYHVHSDNPCGRDNIVSKMESWKKIKRMGLL